MNGPVVKREPEAWCVVDSDGVRRTHVFDHRNNAVLNCCPTSSGYRVARLVDEANVVLLRQTVSMLITQLSWKRLNDSDRAALERARNVMRETREVMNKKEGT